MDIELGILKINCKSGEIEGEDPSSIYIKWANLYQLKIKLGSYEQFLGTDGQRLVTIYDSRNLNSDGTFDSIYGTAQIVTIEGKNYIWFNYSSYPEGKVRIFYSHGRTDVGHEHYNYTDWYVVDDSYTIIIIYSRDYAIEYDESQGKIVREFVMPEEIKEDLGLDILTYLMLTGVLDYKMVYVYPGTYGYYLTDESKQKLENYGLRWRPFRFTYIQGVDPKISGGIYAPGWYHTAKDIHLIYGGYIKEGNYRTRGKVPPRVFEFTRLDGVSVHGNFAALGSSYFERVIFYSFPIKTQETEIHNEANIEILDKTSGCLDIYGWDGHYRPAHRDITKSQGHNHVLHQIPYFRFTFNNGFYKALPERSFYIPEIIEEGSAHYLDKDPIEYINAFEREGRHHIFSPCYSNPNDIVSFGTDEDGNPYIFPGPYFDKMVCKHLIEVKKAYIKNITIFNPGGGPVAYSFYSNIKDAEGDGEEPYIEYENFEILNPSELNKEHYSYPVEIKFSTPIYQYHKWGRGHWKDIDNFSIPIYDLLGTPEYDSAFGVKVGFIDSLESQKGYTPGGSEIEWIVFDADYKVVDIYIEQSFSNIVLGEGTHYFDHCDFINTGNLDTLFTYHPLLVENRHPRDDDFVWYRIWSKLQYCVLKDYDILYQGGSYFYNYDDGYGHQFLTYNYLIGTFQNSSYYNKSGNLYAWYGKGLSNCPCGLPTGIRDPLPSEYYKDPMFVDMFVKNPELVDKAEDGPYACGDAYDYGAMEPWDGYEGVLDFSGEMIDYSQGWEGTSADDDLLIDDGNIGDAGLPLGGGPEKIDLLKNVFCRLRLYKGDLFWLGEHPNVRVNIRWAAPGTENFGLFIDHKEKTKDDKYKNPFVEEQEEFPLEDKCHATFNLKPVISDGNSYISGFSLYGAFGTKYNGGFEHDVIMDFFDADTSDYLGSRSLHYKIVIGSIEMSTTDTVTYYVSVPIINGVTVPVRIIGRLNMCVLSHIETDDFSVKQTNNTFILDYEGGEHLDGIYAVKFFKIYFKSFGNLAWLANLDLQAFVPYDRNRVYDGSENVGFSRLNINLDPTKAYGAFSVPLESPSVSQVFNIDEDKFAMFVLGTDGWLGFGNEEHIYGADPEHILAPSYIEYDFSEKDFESGKMTMDLVWEVKQPVFDLNDPDNIYDERTISDITKIKRFIDVCKENIGEVIYVHLGKYDIGFFKNYKWLVCSIEDVSEEIQQEAVPVINRFNIKVRIVSKIRET